jgi:membrane dipeptidase
LSVDAHFENIDGHLRANFPTLYPNGLTGAARDLHNSVYPIDLHTDSLTSATTFGFDLQKPDWKVTRNRCLHWLFSKFVPVGEHKPLFGHAGYPDITNGGYGGGVHSAHANGHNLAAWLPKPDAWDSVRRHIDHLHKEIGRGAIKNSVFVSNSADLKSAIAHDKYSVLLAAEGTHCLGPILPWTKDVRLRRLEILKREFGAVYLTLDHYCLTDASAASQVIIPLLGTKKGHALTSYGRELLHAALDSGLIIDVTHSTESSVLAACEIAQKRGKPVIASHSSLATLPTSPASKTPGKQVKRGLSDDALLAIASTGGCISILMCPYFHQDKEVDGKPLFDGGLDLLIDQYEYVVNLIRNEGLADGWEHISFGTDFDGGIANIPIELRNAGDLPVLTQRLIDRGWRPENIKKFYGENFLRVWAKNDAT